MNRTVHLLHTAERIAGRVSTIVAASDRKDTDTTESSSVGGTDYYIHVCVCVCVRVYTTIILFTTCIYTYIHNYMYIYYAACTAVLPVDRCNAQVSDNVITTTTTLINGFVYVHPFFFLIDITTVMGERVNLL